MNDFSQILIRPIVSEKSYCLMEDGTYVFVVDRKATKIDVRRAVEAAFGVTVTNVNTLNRKGKSVRNRRTGQMSHRSDEKRAIVTLKQGDSINLFEN